MDDTKYNELVRFLSTAPGDKNRYPLRVYEKGLSNAQRKARKKDVRREANRFELEGEALYITRKKGEKCIRSKVIRKSELPAFLERAHGQEHKKAFMMIRELQVYWPRWEAAVKRFVKACRECRQRKEGTFQGERRSVPTDDHFPKGTRVLVKDPDPTACQPFRCEGTIFEIKSNGTYRVLWGPSGGYDPRERPSAPSARFYSSVDLRRVVDGPIANESESCGEPAPFDPVPALSAPSLESEEEKEEEKEREKEKDDEEEREEEREAEKEKEDDKEREKEREAQRQIEEEDDLAHQEWQMHIQKLPPLPIGVTFFVPCVSSPFPQIFLTQMNQGGSKCKSGYVQLCYIARETYFIEGNILRSTIGQKKGMQENLIFQ
jgi:hypothetical protein